MFIEDGSIKKVFGFGFEKNYYIAESQCTANIRWPVLKASMVATQFFLKAQNFSPILPASNVSSCWISDTCTHSPAPSFSDEVLALSCHAFLELR